MSSCSTNGFCARLRPRRRAISRSPWANAASLVDYARRYLRGQRISTAVVESMVNRVIGRCMAKKQPMRGSRYGAHRLVQIRVAMLDGRLPRVFQRWYPLFRPPEPAAA